jgi:hypothetical protein
MVLLSFLSYTNHTYNSLNKEPRATLCYSDQTYKNLNKQPKGTVIDLIIPTTLTLILINNQKVLLLFLSYTEHAYNSQNKQPRATLS